MSNCIGTVTITSSGLKTLTGFGIDPNRIDASIQAKNGDASQVNVMQGKVDSAGNQAVTHNFYNSTAYAQKSPSGKCVYQREHNGTNWVENLIGNWDSWYTDGLKLNITAYSGGSAYQLVLFGDNT